MLFMLHAVAWAAAVCALDGKPHGKPSVHWDDRGAWCSKMELPVLDCHWMSADRPNVLRE